MRLLFWVALLPSLASAQNCDTDVLFILDASGSVEENYKQMINFMRGVADLLTIGPKGQRVAFMAYSGKRSKILSVPFGVLGSNEDFKLAVDNLPYFKSTTYTGRALKKSRTVLEDRRLDALTVVLVVTDGFSHDIVEVEAQAIRDLDKVVVFVAAIPDFVSKRGMIAISGDASRIFFKPDVLEKARAALQDLLRCEPLADPTTRRPTTTTRATTLPPTTLRTTTTTRATTTTQRVTGCEMDLLLIFDFSGSVDGIHLSYVDMAVQIVNEMRVDPFYTRIALVKYSSRAWAHAVFHFKEYSDARSVINVLRTTEYMGGTTDTNRALEMGSLEYDPKYGARIGLARPVTVIFTDGYSQHDPRPGADLMRNKGVELFAVATEKENYPPNFDELDVITGKNDHVFESKEIEDLKRVLKRYSTNCR